MKTWILILASLGVCGCAMEVSPQAQKDQLESPVTVIAVKDGVTIYKVRDITPGGCSWIYFSSKGDIVVP